MYKYSLTTSDHSRDAAGLTYVYPVISRRAGGLSIGINLNTNNACNWRCIYCQVPNLQRGMAPPVDSDLLRSELAAFFAAIKDGSFFRHTAVPPEYRRIRDIGISGNGEATSVTGFAGIVDIIQEERLAAGLGAAVKLVLITNGSLLRRSSVQSGLVRIQRCNGEVWFKVDAVTRDELHRLNGAVLSPDRLFNNLELSASLCTTWIQTCVFALDGKPAADRDVYLRFISRIVREQLPVKGILLYGLARPSMQPEAERLSALPGEWLQALAEDIRSLGLAVKVLP